MELKLDLGARQILEAQVFSHACPQSAFEQIIVPGLSPKVNTGDGQD
jgi:hypothetical protein